MYGNFSPTEETKKCKKRKQYQKGGTVMALSNLADWKENSANASCGTGCGASDEGENTNSACGTGCGASDETGK